MEALFTAKLTSCPRFARLTGGKVYDVIDFNDYFGNYIIIDDDGQRCALDWHCFEDQGRASTAYQRGAKL